MNRQKHIGCLPEAVQKAVVILLRYMSGSIHSRIFNEREERQIAKEALRDLHPRLKKHRAEIAEGLEKERLKKEGR